MNENNNIVKQYELINDVETNVIEFVYDSNNSPIYFTYNNATYYYEKNMQGDIVAILDANGNIVVKYTYDIWGKLVSTTGTLADTLGVINPLRYRGYYYDTETGLYYLQSRYYSPDLMRFISQDDAKLSNRQGQPLGSNLYTYCLNNPVMNVDPTGKLPIWAKITIGIVGIAASVALTIATGGAALPALIATLKFVAGSVAISMAIEGLIGYLTGGTAGLKEGLINGAADGFMWGGIGAAVSAAAKAIRVFKTGKAISSACFVAGTLIATENNFVPIEQIQQGDLVWAENPETGEKSLKPVVATFVRETYEFVHIQVDGQNITTTPEHPFWVSQKGWTDATNLRVGDYLVLQNGKSAIIEFVQHESLEIPAIVYNFEVEDFHTYYVTDSAVLVHNKCGMGNFRTLKETTIKGYKVSMDLERGGSGLLNIHLKVNKTKYFWNGKQFVSSAGKAIPNLLKNNAKIQKALQKALEAIAKGRL